jgi:hypothetical protein
MPIQVVNLNLDESLLSDVELNTVFLVVDIDDNKQNLEESLANSSVAFVSLPTKPIGDLGEDTTLDTIHQILMQCNFQLAGVLKQTMWSVTGHPLIAETIYKRA